MKKFLANLTAYFALLWSVQFKTASVDLQNKTAQANKAKNIEAAKAQPQYKWAVEVNTGAGMRKMNVDAADKYTAELTAMTKYMKQFFKVRAYQLTFIPNPEVKQVAAASASAEAVEKSATPDQNKK